MSIAFPWETPPPPEQPCQVAQGIWWVRVPLAMALDHVNCFLADDGDGWTVIDTGLDDAPTRALWRHLLEGPFAGKPVTRVLVTHHHPDHIGLAGWFMEQGAALWTSSIAYLTARMLTLDLQERPSLDTIAFWESAGMAPDVLSARRQTRPFNFADCVAPLPLGHIALHEGDQIKLAGRTWHVRLGQGHAPDHVTLWAEDEPLIIGGDQILPGISPNVSVYPTAPEADPLGAWIDSCARFSGLAAPDQLLLGGHKLPFRGVPHRLSQLEQNHHSALDRLHDHIANPKVAGDCFTPLFKRKIDAGIYGLALGEALAHLAHLRAQGRARRWREGRAWMWQAI